MFRKVSTQTGDIETEKTYLVSKDGTEKLIHTSTTKHYDDNDPLSKYMSKSITTCFISGENSNHIKISSQPIYKFT